VKLVVVPVSDVNSETALITEWLVEDRAAVSKDDVIAEIETSKAVLDVIAPGDGFLLRGAPAGSQIPLADPIALLFDDLAELEAHAEDVARAAAEVAAGNGAAVRASAPARRRAEELGVDLESLSVNGLITVKDVEEAAGGQPERQLPEPLSGPPGLERVLLIGGGQGAQQVMEIFAARGDQAAVGILDDDSSRWGAQVGDVPVVGGAQRLEELFAAGAFDAAIVAISTSIPARRKFRELLGRLGIPMANAIDPTARIARDVRMGRGNVICAFCHFGASTVVGDNNFISAYNSFDHHNVLGNDSSTGPGCMTSGDVQLGDGVRWGTGVFVEPHVRVGHEAKVASGAIVTASVPAEHTVKTKVVTTAVVPPRTPRA
jgi:sugar O-acyltransferase (sialic acid O-acetyltransferase NeuD family)